MTVLLPINFVTGLLQQGRYSFSRAEAGSALRQEGPSLSQTLKRLCDKGWARSFSRGFYLALDVQHQSTGLDPKWFVDDWAGFVGAEYYVAGLSAAALHGAAHQRLASFQVIANRRVRSIRHPNLRFDVFYKKGINEAMHVEMKSPAGYFRVSTPEMTAYDVIKYQHACPSLDLAATVMVELGEVLRKAKLKQLPEQDCATAVLQRLGWVLDRVGWAEKADGLAEALLNRRLVWRALDSRLPKDGNRNDRWQIIENTDVQPDIER